MVEIKTSLMSIITHQPGWTASTSAEISRFWRSVNFSNMSAYQLTFFCHSAAASLASPRHNKDTTSHPSLLFRLTCEPIKCMVCCKIKPITREIRKVHLGFETGTVGRLGAHSKKDMIFGAVPKYA